MCQFCVTLLCVSVTLFVIVNEKEETRRETKGIYFIRMKQACNLIVSNGSICVLNSLSRTYKSGSRNPGKVLLIELKVLPVELLENLLC